MDFCHISPTKYLDIFASGRKTHLVLAHLIETDDAYAEWYKKEKRLNGCTIIMDNSAFEMYKQGRPMYDPSKLVEMANRVNADYVVMPDYPNEPPSKTIDAAERIHNQLSQAGLKTFFCPQSTIGDIDGLIDSYMWAVRTSWIHYIGFSILAIPNAYGVEKENKLQRFISRWKFLHELKDRGFFRYVAERRASNHLKLHLLGMLDGPNEVLLLKEFLPHFASWDSSAAVWYGINGITFDQSPTGMYSGKWEKEVDFSHELARISDIGKAVRNVKYIDDMVESIINPPKEIYNLNDYRVKNDRQREIQRETNSRGLI